MDSVQTYDPTMDQDMSENPDIGDYINKILFLREMPMGNYFTGNEKLRIKQEILISDFIEPLKLCKKYVENEEKIRSKNDTISMIRMSVIFENPLFFPPYNGIGHYHSIKPFLEIIDKYERRNKEISDEINRMTNGNMDKMMEMYESYKEYI